MPSEKTQAKDQSKAETNDEDKKPDKQDSEKTQAKDQPKAKTNDKDKKPDKQDKKEPESAFAGGGNWLNLVSPEGVVMLFCSLLLDMIGWILLLFGLDDIGVTDFMGILLIGGWALLRFGTISFGGKAKSTGKRFIITTIIELIPWLGSLSPTWTIFVISELRKN